MWERFKDWLDYYSFDLKIIGIIVVALSVAFIVIYYSPSNKEITSARKICMSECKKIGGTHGRLLLPNNDDGFFECRCISKDYPKEIINIIIENWKAVKSEGNRGN